MHLVKWFRKNKSKIMAVVVIILMVGFIGGSSLSYILGQGSAKKKAVAYYGQKTKITDYDLDYARQELEILKSLQAPQILKKTISPLMRAPDLTMVMLGELLFPDQGLSPMINMQIKQMVQNTGLIVSENEIDSIYTGSMGNVNLLWLLLKAEAHQAGIKIPIDQAAQQLAALLPKVNPEFSYANIMRFMTQKRSISEKRALQVYADLMAVGEYARLVCSAENLTQAQLKHLVRNEIERLNADVVPVRADSFTDEIEDPAQDEILQHLNTYKGNLANEMNEANPYGFGYKQPARIQLEYIAVKREQAEKIADAPTAEEMESFYQQNVDQFTQTVPLDPNDPNSETTTVTQSFAQVVGTISERLFNRKVQSTMIRILEDAKRKVEQGLQESDLMINEMTDEQYEQASGDYSNVVAELSKKYEIDLIAGQTGLLSILDMSADEVLPRLYLQSHVHAPIRLPELAFAVDPLNLTQLGPFDAPKPRLYQTLGPCTDMMGEFALIARIVDAQPSFVPDDMNLTFSLETISLDANTPSQTYVLKEKIVEDMKKKAAMTMAQQAAQQLIEKAPQDGWDTAVDAMNEKYPGKEPNQPNFELIPLQGLRHISNMSIFTTSVQFAGDPKGPFIILEQKRQQALVQKLYDLLDETDSNDFEPTVFEFPPEPAYYCVKDVNITPVVTDQYLRAKSIFAFQQDFTVQQSLAIDHYNPENILERMNFKVVKQSDANEPNTAAQ